MIVGVIVGVMMITMAIAGGIMGVILSAGSAARSVRGSGFLIAVGIAGGMAIGIAVGISEGSALGIAAGTVSSVTLWRAYYHAFAWILVWPRVHGDWYPWHPVAWDDLCGLPFPGLDRLLAAYADHDRAASEAEIERLISSYSFRSQRHNALRARARLVARDAAIAPSLRQADAIVARLPEGSDGFLAETAAVKEWVGEIALLQRQVDIADRPLFRDPLAELLLEKVDHFAHRIAGLHEPLASEFRQAATNWLAIARRQREEVRRCRDREPTPQVFRAGDPVRREQEAFVARLGVFGELERQVMLSTGCPGIVLYGRRRTGKSTVLLNLGGFLPATVLPVCLSMQDPKAFASLASLISLLITRIREALGTVAPPVPISAEAVGLAELFAFLGEANRSLEKDDRRLLIGLDEYEMIDDKIGQGVLPQELLDTLRESIQSHRQITWILVGSHEITDLRHAPWTSYLVSARTIELPLFSREETTLLLTDPLQHSRFWREKDRQRPRFASAFWGEDGIERIHAEAGGWPHLVQLIAETAIDLVNDSGRREIGAALLERALEQAIVKGHNVLYELSRRESRLPGEWEYLRGFAGSERQPPPADPRVCASLRRRLLLVESAGECVLRVPLMRRWLIERAWRIED
ncbi:MAG: hypothetical protein DVS81_03610 [Candidatus Accumulibacter meliphilus]|uniref:ATP-binding protein n=1 Tax=Candidatus Accumulibacter meliphilus TaxID=2211374 RepID=A0A369XPE1_9PROT|nr:MAG: hypothetical protein DVS81_03610 [Candidatus Accumulibacter meliphilus]